MPPAPAPASGLVADLLRLLSANVPTWPTPPPETLAALAPLLSTRRLPAGALVLAQGQATPALFGVLSGAVEIRLGAVDGAVSVVEVTGPLRLFGLASFASGLPSTYEALTQAPTRLLVIGPAAYGHLMDQVPGFARALMAEFARRHDTTLRLLTEARHLGAMERLTLVLDRLAGEQQGQAPRDAQGAIGLAATQAGLAQRAGLSRQTVNALLSRLQAQGRLRRAYGRLWLGPTNDTAPSTHSR